MSKTDKTRPFWVRLKDPTLKHYVREEEYGLWPTLYGWGTGHFTIRCSSQCPHGRWYIAKKKAKKRSNKHRARKEIQEWLTLNDV